MSHLKVSICLKFHRLARKHSFDLGLATEDPVSHLPIVTTFAFQLDIVESRLKILWMKFNTGPTKLQTASSQMYLDKDLFDSVRGMIDEETAQYNNQYFVIDL